MLLIAKVAERRLNTFITAAANAGIPATVTVSGIGEQHKDLLWRVHSQNLSRYEFRLHIQS